MIQKPYTYLRPYLLWAFFIFLQPSAQVAKETAKEILGGLLPKKTVQDIDDNVGPILKEIRGPILTKIQNVAEGLTIPQKTNKELQTGISNTAAIVDKVGGFVDGMIEVPPPHEPNLGAETHSPEVQKAHQKGAKLVERLDHTLDLLQTVLRLGAILLAIILFSKLKTLSDRLFTEAYTALANGWHAAYAMVRNWINLYRGRSQSAKPSNNQPAQPDNEQQKSKSQNPLPGF